MGETDRPAQLTLRVGLNLAFLLPGETGGRETYARELFGALATARPDIDLVSFVNREAAATSGFWRELGPVVRLPITPRSRPAWAWAELAAVPLAASRNSVDVLHSPANFGPITGPFTRVLTLHDVLFRSRPDFLSRASRVGTEAMLPAAARSAHRLITVSESSRSEIVRLLKVPWDRVEVIPNGWVQPATAGDPESARRLVGAGRRPIAVCVASDLPHKNLPLLLEALALIEPPERPFLVLAGRGTETGELPGLAGRLRLENDVSTLGAVDPKTLEDLYAAAAVVITPTLLEGFGLPVLEALGRGVPVACSDLPVLREVAGQAAIYFDPSDPRAASDALRRVLAGGPGVEQLREEGRERARRQNWNHAAQAIARTYEAAWHSAKKHP